MLSAVGLERLDFKNKIKEYLDFIPAVGQGAMVLEFRKEDLHLKEENAIALYRAISAS